MLDISTTLSNVQPVIGGRYLSHNRLKPRDRARLAAAIANGEVKVEDLTVRQAALLCRVSVPLVTDARRPQAETLAQHFTRSTAEERIEFARSAGIDLIWDELIQPLI
jgi:hypothetical protein